MKNNVLGLPGLLSEMKQAASGWVRRYRKKRVARNLPFAGYPTPRSGIKYVDLLDDEDLKELNSLLDWNCFIADGRGRRFGLAAWGNKRIAPQVIPDPRITRMHERFDLHDKHVLEIGCFEGVHTLGLLGYAQRVTAVDARIDNVVKAIVRCSLSGHAPSIFKCDIESAETDTTLLQADLLHHVGVLYHLRDPVTHLLSLGRYIGKGLMLDTHYCLPEHVTGSYNAGGKSYLYQHYLEYGKKEVFSGMYDHSKWLLLDDIVACLKQTGFDKVEVVETRQERNGPRVLLFAERTA